MKKVLDIFVLFILITSLTSCFPFVIDEYEDGWYYGVATYLDDTDHLILNIPTIGYTEIPEGRVQTWFEEEPIEDYEIQEGDLVKLWFLKKTDISILESYPARFENDPSSIYVYKQNTSLVSTDEGWIFEFELVDDLIYETSDLSGLEIDKAYISYYQKYGSSDETYYYLATYILVALTEEKIAILIDHTSIIDVLQKYGYNIMYISDEAVESEEIE